MKIAFFIFQICGIMFNSMGPFFVDFGIFAYLWGGKFVDALLFSFKKKLTFL